MFLKKLTAAAAMAILVCAAGAGAQTGTQGFTTRYWDGCKAHCSWDEHSVDKGLPRAATCGIDGKTVLSGSGGASACSNNGPAFSCYNNRPYAVNDQLAYGMAAFLSGNCGDCYELTFTGNGAPASIAGEAASATNVLTRALANKKMIVILRNIGHIQQHQFDILIPGGGVGDYDAFTRQTNIPENQQGARYGGLLGGFCNWGANASDKDCLETRCRSVFANHPDLLDGCLFHVNWMSAANNPEVRYTKVTCPNDLLEMYKTGTRPSGGQPPPVTKYSLSISRNPTTGGGDVDRIVGSDSTRNPSGSGSYDQGTSVRLVARPATNYTFTRWEAVSGQLPSGINATNASITFTMTANVSIRAVFTADVVTQTYSVEVNRNLNDGGNVTVTPVGGTAQTNPGNRVQVDVGTNVTVAATTNDGYTFIGWTVVSGTRPSSFNTNNASNTFSLTANQTLNLRANWTKNSVVEDKYTLSITRSPIATGNTVTLNGTTTSSQQTYDLDKDASVTLQAFAGGNYEFTHWDGLPSGANSTQNPVTFTIGSDMSVTANYKLKEDDNPCTENCGGGGGEKDTITIEAESFSSRDKGECNSWHPQDDQVSIENETDASGGQIIGYTCGGSKATYSNINVPRNGNYTMAFRVASGESGGFEVFVNGQKVDLVNVATGSFNTWTTVTVPVEVFLSETGNTIRLDFTGATNVDYFLLIGEKPTSVRYNAIRTNKQTKSQIVLRPASGGFIAGLPANHKYTSYRVIDMQGREVKRGKVGSGASDLKISGVKSGVVFLRLEGPGVKPQVLRATATR